MASQDLTIYRMTNNLNMTKQPGHVSNWDALALICNLIDPLAALGFELRHQRDERLLERAPLLRTRRSG